jgi:hypothetical protein
LLFECRLQNSSKNSSSKGKSNKKQPKYKAAAAMAMETSSTRVETTTGSHVTTVVTENFATAEEPPSGLASSFNSAANTPDANANAAAVGSSGQASTPPSNWLEHGREAWNDKASSSERRVVVAYSSYSTAFECRGPWGCVQWSDIDDQYALSFVFEGNFAPSIRCFPAGTNSSSDEIETNVSIQIHSKSFYDLIV